MEIKSINLIVGNIQNNNYEKLESILKYKGEPE